MAEWLNTTFNGFDSSILEFMHGLAENCGGFLTPLMKFITLIGEKGLWMFALALILMCFSKTRKIGVCLFGAVSCGALITNIVLKDWVARLRPFENSQLYAAWWNAVGAPAEEGFSFPSGHVTAAMSGVTALVLAWRKKWMPLGYLYVILMAFARNYLMAHFPSDVLAAVLVGAISGIVAWFITKGIYAFLEKYRENKLCGWILRFDLIKIKK
ncbi:MAG: phosphatase PAP2 family protein [Clostridia bacterium]|nr:phosphatase PAP2 family protein [Clostridia bacterium]